MALLWTLSTLMLVICYNYGFLFDNVINVVSVAAPVGEIVGKIETITFDGRQYNVKEFFGIPYAEPPIGHRRFRKPVPKANFTHSFHAFDHGAACLQRSDGNIGTNPNMPISEDCLFLNIFTPERANTSSKIPVMIWIHGGWFQIGVSSEYYGDVLSVFGDVIVVTINYRLAHLGFLRVDEEIGNFGLWDQHLALKWVQDNIASFGGDIDNITLFGESAGSVSVAYQALFAGNKNLFHRGIGESGSITSPWGFATNESASKQFDDFTAVAGCNGTHDQKLDCLRKLTTNEILDVMHNDAAYHSLILPNRDKDFVPKHPKDMQKPLPDLRKSHDFFHSLDFIMGSNSFDGGLYLPTYAYSMNTTDIEHFTIQKDRYESFFVPKLLSNVYYNVKNIPQIIKDLTVFEYTNWEKPNDDKERMKMLVKLTTDTAMFAPMVSTAQLHSQGGRGNTYIFEFSASPAIHTRYIPSYMDGPTMANHADELMFVFGFSERMQAAFLTFLDNYNFTDLNLQTSKAIMTMWTNFAKTG